MRNGLGNILRSVMTGLAGLALAIVVSGCADDDSTPPPPAAPTATTSATASRTPTEAAQNPTHTPTSQPSTPTPSFTIADPTFTGTPTQTPTATRQDTPDATETPTETATSAPETTPTDTPEPTETPTRTVSPESPTETPTTEPTSTPMFIPVLPNLEASDPAESGSFVARSAWLRFTFSDSVPNAAAATFDLECDGSPHPFVAQVVQARTVVLNPTADLPAAATCVVSWDSASGTESFSVQTRPAAAAPFVIYDRTNVSAPHPFPDDFWLATDSSTRTGFRLAMPVPALVGNGPDIFAALLTDANQLDGFSPIAHFVVEVSQPIDGQSIPHTAAQSLDPFATLALFDIDPESPSYGERVPFITDARNDLSVKNVLSHTLLVFPSIPLRPKGHYGFVVTRRVSAAQQNNFEPSDAFKAVIDVATDGEPPAVAQARPLVEEVLDFVENEAVPTIPRDDIALALRISIRSTDDIPSDLLAIKSQILEMPPPALTIDQVQPVANPQSPILAIVKGTWEAPDWRAGNFFGRDENGVPTQILTNPVAFTLALPRAAIDGPVPITMYQHGNPGSSEAEVPNFANRGLAAAGFALIGFTDILNREYSAGASNDDEAIEMQVTAILIPLILERHIPDAFLQTNAEQLAFLRTIEQLSTLDVVPLGAPDGVPDLDVDAPRTYLGISQGANHAPAFLPYAPEVSAAALTVGGGRLAETLIHQLPEALLIGVGSFFPDLSPAEFWVGLSLFQTDFDRQEPHNHASFLYRNPVEVTGTTRKASILLTEGLGDSLVPNNATDSLAWAIGPLPHLEPRQRPVPFLQPIVGPLMANIDAETTGAFYQYVPANNPDGIPNTPGCASQPEGHYCPQSSTEGIAQRVEFFLSALDGVPAIVDPLAEE